MAAKEHKKLGDYAYKKYEKSGYEDFSLYEQLESHRRRQEFHEEQEKQVGIRELQEKDNFADYSVPELNKDEIKAIYKNNFTKGGINVYELKPEIWKEISSYFTPEELKKKKDWNISGVQKFETILKNSLRPEAHSSSERIYNIGREWGVEPKKVHQAFMRMRQIAQKDKNVPEYTVGKDLDSDIILAKVNGVDIGSIDIKYVNGNPNVRNIHVYPEHRRNGIASELIRLAEKQHGKLIVVPTTEEGKALWTKMGYSQNPDSKYWYKK